MRNPYDIIGRLGLLLAIAGAVNWLLVGLFEWNLVQWLFTQSGTQIVDNLGERIVYIVVGVGGVLALPMLAATLARARSRDVSSEERGRSATGLSEDDTAFYYGAPKNDRELAREQQHVRRIERVIVEEPIPERSTATSAAETSAEASTSAVGSERRSPEESLRYGTVEETTKAWPQAMTSGAGRRDEARRRRAMPPGAAGDQGRRGGRSVLPAAPASRPGDAA